MNSPRKPAGTSRPAPVRKVVSQRAPRKAVARTRPRQATGAVSLAFRNGAFFAGVNGKAISLRSIPVPETTRTVAAFRRDDRYVVWDARGLTVRSARGTLTTRFEELAVSPRLFDAAGIRDTLRLIKAGVRKKEADSLSGAVRIGGDVYLLPRWTDSRGETWLEALVRVPLGGEAAKPVLVGRFAGLTTAYQEIDDELGIVDGRPAAIVRTKDSWGVAAALPVAKEFGYIPLGTDLLWTTGTAYAERTGYGTVLVGTVDRKEMTRSMRLEARADGAALDPVGPEGRIVRFVSEGATVLADVRSGSQLRFAGEWLAVPAPLPGRPAVLLFDDPVRPTRAVLVGIGDELESLATWPTP